MAIKLSRSKRILALCSAVWLVLIFVTSLVQANHPVSRGRSGYASGGFDIIEFLALFMLLGVAPALVLWGVMWIRSTPERDGAIEDFLVGVPLSPDIHCPRCNASMRLKTTNSGANAGKVFWGCSRFPTCNQIAPLAAGAPHRSA